MRVVSLSGGKSSAYVAANYPSDLLLFALVCVSDPLLKIKDEGIRRLVSEKIGKEFVGTAESDDILRTMFDLEQFLGRPISWVAGDYFEDVIDEKQILPNQFRRYCTTELKIRPMFRHLHALGVTPVETLIGFRSGEGHRAQRMMEKTIDGVAYFKDVVGQHEDGRKRWATLPFQRPIFPMIQDGVRSDQVHLFWKDSPVHFATRNNCVGCFHRNPILLRMMKDEDPVTFDWFLRQEERVGGTWRSDASFAEIAKHRLQAVLDFEDFGSCDSGSCGL